MPSPDTSGKVAVIGGGWAGMAAAVELASHDVPVVVFEAARTLGGRARRVVHDGVALDNGLHILAGAYRETLGLIRRVDGPAAKLARLPLDWRIEDRFRLRAPRLPAPLHLVAALLSATGIGWPERLAAHRLLRALRAGGFRVEPDRTVARMLIEHAQPAALVRYLWDPLCVAALNTPAGQASAAVFARVLRDAFAGSRDASDMLLAQTDLSALFPEPAAEWIATRGGHVTTNCAVRAIHREGDGFVLQTRRGEARCAQIVCAVAPHSAAPLLAALPGLASTAVAINRLQHQPIVSVFLQHQRSVRLPAPMIGLDAAIGQWVFDREAICGQRGLVGVVISADGPHRRMPPETLAARVRAEIAARYGPLPPLLWHRVFAEKRATFACTPDLERPPQRTPLPGLWLAGDYTAGDYPATLEAAVLSGLACARGILDERAG